MLTKPNLSLLQAVDDSFACQPDQQRENAGGAQGHAETAGVFPDRAQYQCQHDIGDIGDHVHETGGGSQINGRHDTAGQTENGAVIGAAENGEQHADGQSDTGMSGQTQYDIEDADRQNGGVGDPAARKPAQQGAAVGTSQRAGQKDEAGGKAPCHGGAGFIHIGQNGRKPLAEVVQCAVGQTVEHAQRPDRNGSRNRTQGMKQIAQRSG